MSCMAWRPGLCPEKAGERAEAGGPSSLGGLFPPAQPSGPTELSQIWGAALGQPLAFAQATSPWQAWPSCLLCASLLSTRPSRPSVQGQRRGRACAGARGERYPGERVHRQHLCSFSTFTVGCPGPQQGWGPQEGLPAGPRAWLGSGMPGAICRMSWKLAATRRRWEPSQKTLPQPVQQ